MIGEPRNRKLTFIDLFAGCGGLSEGFLQSEQFNSLAHVEWELPMVQTLRARLVSRWNYSKDAALKSVIHFDLQKTCMLLNGTNNGKFEGYEKTNHPAIINKGLKGLISEQKVDVIIGGPPCQAYSLAGRAQDKNSMQDDYRNYLFESFVKVVDAFKPKVFVFENVPGILSACPGGFPVTERIYDAFKNIGYKIRKPEELKHSQFLASDFGVPQKRKRVIIIGVNQQNGPDLEAIHETLYSLANQNDVRTVRSAIEHLPELVPLTKKRKLNGNNVSHTQADFLPINSHEPRYHNSRDIKIFREWIDMGMNDKPSDEKISFYNKRLGKNSKHGKYRNLEWDKPSPTIVSHLNKDGLLFIHPDIEQARSITVKEAALLQSFPDDYEFLGKLGQCYKMIGNAVPPAMASSIAKSVSENLVK